MARYTTETPIGTKPNIAQQICNVFFQVCQIANRNGTALVSRA